MRRTAIRELGRIPLLPRCGGRADRPERPEPFPVMELEITALSGSAFVSSGRRALAPSQPIDLMNSACVAVSSWGSGKPIRLMRALTATSVCWSKDAIRFANRFTKASRSWSGIARLIQPYRSAVAASKSSAPRRISIARDSDQQWEPLRRPATGDNADSDLRLAEDGPFEAGKPHVAGEQELVADPARPIPHRRYGDHAACGHSCREVDPRWQSIGSRGDRRLCGAAHVIMGDEKLRIGALGDHHVRRIIRFHLFDQGLELSDRVRIERVDRWIEERQSPQGGGRFRDVRLRGKKRRCICSGPISTRPGSLRRAFPFPAPATSLRAGCPFSTLIRS